MFEPEGGEDRTTRQGATTLTHSIRSQTSGLVPLPEERVPVKTTEVGKSGRDRPSTGFSTGSDCASVHCNCGKHAGCGLKNRRIGPEHPGVIADTIRQPEVDATPGECGFAYNQTRNDRQQPSAVHGNAHCLYVIRRDCEGIRCPAVCRPTLNTLCLRTGPSARRDTHGTGRSSLSDPGCPVPADRVGRPCLLREVYPMNMHPILSAPSGTLSPVVAGAGSRLFRRCSMVLGAAMLSQSVQAQVDCASWDTLELPKDVEVSDVKRCLDAGADPNVRNAEAFTPLHVAAFGNTDPVLIRLLLQAGADPNAGNVYGVTPLHTAVVSNQNPVATALLLDAGADPNAHSVIMRTPLDISIASNTNPAIIVLLLDAGADPDAPGVFSATPLHVAASDNTNPETISLLLDAGAELDARTEYGATPLHNAASRNTNPDVIARLLDAGADPNARGILDLTPLHAAASDNTNPDIAALLLGSGADPNARDGEGNSPLHFAARSNRNPDVMTLLLEAGADPSARNAQGKTPYELARQFNARIGDTEAWQRLLEGSL